MKVTNEKVENRQAYLTIEMEPAEMLEYQDKAYKSLAKRVSVPGFRRGKAPRLMLERYVGEDKFKEETLNILVPEAFKKATTQEKIEAFAQPEINVEKPDPLTFKAIIPLAPITKIADYKSIRMEPEPVSLTDEAVNNAIEQLRHQYATWEPVERAVELNDMVNMDVNSTVETQNYLDRKNVQYQVTKDLPLPAPGFAEQLVGMKPNDEKEFTLKFPEDYPRPELANKEASFKVKILEVKQEKLPEVNEDFAKQVNPDFKTVEEFKKAVNDDMKRQLEERARLTFQDKVVEKLVEGSSVEFPPVLTQIETDNIIRNNMREMRIDDFQEYQNTVGKTEKQLREQFEEDAKKRVTRSLILDKIAEEEKIKVSHEEVHEEIDNMVENADTEERRKSLEDYLATERAHETIEGLLLTRKSVERLANIAMGKTVETAEVIEGETKEEQK